MVHRVGYEELAGRGGVAFKIKEDAVDLCLGMGIIALGDGGGEGGIAIDKLKGIVGELP